MNRKELDKILEESDFNLIASLVKVKNNHIFYVVATDLPDATWFKIPFEKATGEYLMMMDVSKIIEFLVEDE